jgi:hypothetical protein
MATYTVKLTPALRNPGTEGSMDEAIVNGVSIQRSVSMVQVENTTNKKIVGSIVDGGTFTDTIDTLTTYPGAFVI